MNDSKHIVLRTRGNGNIEINGNSISGWEEFENTRQYFYITMNQPFAKFGSIKNNEIIPGQSSLSGRGISAFVSFDKLNEQVELRIGISFISTEQAQKNLTSETIEKRKPGFGTVFFR